MLATELKNAIKSILPKPFVDPARRKYWKLVIEIDKLRDVVRFIRNRTTRVSFARRVGIIKSYYVTSAHVDSPHTPGEILTYVETILT